MRTAEARSIAIKPDADLGESLQTLARIAAVAIICLGFVRLAPAISFTQIHNDFSHYYIGGMLFAGGYNVYTTGIEPFCEQLNVPYDPTIPYAAHPPLILAWFSLFSLLPIKVAYGVWLACQLSCAAGFAELTRRILKFRWDSAFWLFIIGIALNTLSFRLLFYHSQIQLAVGAIIYATILADQNQRSKLACCLITIAAAIKIYPVVLAPWFFFRHLNNWRDASLRVAAMAVTSLICLAIPTFAVWLDFVELGVPSLAEHATKWCNYSIHNLVHFLARVSGDPAANAGALSPKLLATIAAVASIVAAYGLAFSMRRVPIAAVSVLLCVTMFSGIITWSHYLTVLLLPLALLAKHAAEQNNYSLQAATLATGLLMLTPKLDFAIFESVGWSYLRVITHFYPLYTAIAIVALLWILRNRIALDAPKHSQN